MKSQQSGFTLVEIAIVLVIIGLLLGGILKGQELINSAKVKNLANDYRVIPTYIYGFQDKFKQLPGDDSAALTHMAGCVAPCANGNGNGIINGNWDSTTVTDETVQFWAHVRHANLAAGSTDLGNMGEFEPRNAVGGRIGISSLSTGQPHITGMPGGSYQICSKAILGKFARQLDVQMDDGNTATGSMRTVVDTAAIGTAAPAMTATFPDESTTHTVCMVF
jgi:prepilin-type N-terminal cleavage/methylation domain-containing protein